MRRDGLSVVLVLAGVIVFFFAGSFLFAQGTPAPGTEAQTLPGQVPERELITDNWKQAPVNQILDQIAERAGKTIDHADIPDLIDFKCTQMNWREAVEAVADKARCVVREVENHLVVEKPPRVTMEFKKAELVEVINLLAKQAGANIVIDSGVKGDVTMRFSDVPWMRALSAVVKTAGYTLVEEDRGRIIRVVDPAKLQAQMETKVIRFMYIKPDEYYKARITTNHHVGTTPTPTADVAKGFTLLDTLRTMLSRSTATGRGGAAGAATLGRLDYIKDANCILVTDTKPVLDRMTQVIHELDIEPEQILADVTFVTTRNTDLVQLGVNWSKTGGSNGFEFSTSPTDQNGTSTGQSTSRFPFNLGGRLKGSETAGLHQAFFNDYGMTATLRLFSEDTDTEFLQRPSIATRNHVEATIFVGEEIHYAETNATTNQAGGLQITITEAGKSPVNVGFQLFIIPHVVTGTNKILMTVIPQDETLTGTTSDIVGFEKFTASSGGTTASIDLPRKQQATIVTHMLLESGQTMVVGGLVQDRMTHTLRKVPYAGDLPILGWLFKRRDEQFEKNHLFVFITPRIILGAQEESKALAIRDAARRSELEGGYNWIQGPPTDQAFLERLQGRQAERESEWSHLEQGAPPSGTQGK